MVKAADMLIARRADTRARADFATWKMMAKLNGSSALPPEAQEFLASYQNLLAQMSEGDATEATIGAIYKAYYAEMREPRPTSALARPSRQRTMLPPSAARLRRRRSPPPSGRRPSRDPRNDRCRWR